MLLFRHHDYQAMRDHAQRSYPHECCGVLLGSVTDPGPAAGNLPADTQRRVARVVPCRNLRVADHRAADRYQIDPIELLAAQRNGRAHGLEIVGFYHSHPDHPAQWSSTDLAEAHWIGCSYVITSVERGDPTLTNAFVLRGRLEEDKHFEPEALVVLDPDMAAPTTTTTTARISAQEDSEPCPTRT